MQRFATLKATSLAMRRAMSTMNSAIAHIRIAEGEAANKVNSLGLVCRTNLISSLKSAQSDTAIKAIVITGSSHSSAFCAGADIKEFASMSTSSSAPTPSLQDVLNQIEASKKPTIAAIQGVALGGGLELALSCNYRITDPRAKLGLPEVHLGIIPGAGGTQRLPRVGGIPFALDMITSGRMAGAAEAVKNGVVDSVHSDKDVTFESFYEKFALDVMGKPEGSHPLVRNLAVKGSKEDNDKAIAFVKSKLPKTTMGGDAAHGCVDAVALSIDGSDFDAGINGEQTIFLNLLTKSKQGAARRHLFFAERSSTSPSPLLPRVNVKDLGKKIGVIGAGTMGSGIATCFLRAGYDVKLVDINPDGLANGVKTIEGNIGSDVKRGRATKESAEGNLKMLSSSTTLSDLKDVDMVVEAAFENMELKKKIFKELDGIVRPDTILATNTSTLDIDAIGSVVSNPDRTMGMHFFSPANVMKLVENVQSKHSSGDTIAKVTAYTKKIGKVGVLVKNCDGFVGNRMVHPYTQEALFCLDDGASVADVDRSVTSLGMAIGPFLMGDIAGNDIGYLIRQSKNYVDPATRPAGMRYTNVGDKMVVDLGRKGQKAGKGWYDYDINVGKGRVPGPSAEIKAFLEEHRKGLNGGEVKEAHFTSTELAERNLFPLVNEGFKILEEGIANHPNDIDVIYVYGYGFPVWRGGPIWWADQEVGLAHILAELEKASAKYPTEEYLKPSALLREMVEKKISVYDFFDAKAKEERRLSKL